MSFVEKRRRVLMVGHSYVVSLNRRLPNEIQKNHGGHWAVTVVAPREFRGDLGPIVTIKDEADLAELITVPVRAARSPHLFWYSRQLKRMTAEAWDVIHVWEEPYVLAGAQIAKWANPRSTVIYWTGQSIEKHFPWPFSRFERYSIDRSTAWASRGQTGCDAVLQKGYGRRMHRILPLGVDTQLFAPDEAAREKTRQSLGWRDAIPVVGFLGRFVPEKGLALMLRTLETTEQPWRALFVGGGPLEGTLRQWASRYAPGRVRVLTGLGHAQVPDVLRAMDVLLCPSQTTTRWREVFGRMLIEASACGVPCIVSDSGEIPRVVGDTASVVPEADESGWRRALDEHLSDGDLRRRRSEAGRRRALSEFAWPVVAARHVDFFTAALEQRRAAP